MLNITNHEGNKNQNQYHFTPLRMAIIKRQNITSSVGEDVEKWQHLYTVSEEYKFVQSLRKTLISSVQFSRSVMSNSLRPCESQHARPPVHHQLPEFTQTHAH